MGGVGRVACRRRIFSTRARRRRKFFLYIAGWVTTSWRVGRGWQVGGSRLPGGGRPQAGRGWVAAAGWSGRIRVGRIRVGSDSGRIQIGSVSGRAIFPSMFLIAR